jgi:hypothetical protein
MRRIILFILSIYTCGAQAQEMAAVANKFISSLSPEQKQKTMHSFDMEERFNFHYFPINNRGGLPLDEMTEAQQSSVFQLIKTSLSASTVKKIKEIIELENILKELENRKADDHFRDPGKYYLAIFGTPANNAIWGWRFEGHHVSFNFSTKDNQLVSGTPGFLGANPAVVQSGKLKGREVLSEEKILAFNLLHHFTAEQLKKVIIASDAPGEIITGTDRKALIKNPAGLKYSEMNKQQQEELMKLIHLYVFRYKKDFANRMLKEIKDAGWQYLQFAWAGHQEPGIGHPHYYRIQGPTIIIEYDNTQNNANHVHTVVRDLLHDYGGDKLLEHYHQGHHH